MPRPWSREHHSGSATAQVHQPEEPAAHEAAAQGRPRLGRPLWVPRFVSLHQARVLELPTRLTSVVQGFGSCVLRVTPDQAGPRGLSVTSCPAEAHGTSAGPAEDRRRFSHVPVTFLLGEEVPTTPGAIAQVRKGLRRCSCPRPQSPRPVAGPKPAQWGRRAQSRALRSCGSPPPLGNVFPAASPVN